jgi:hypothetical protein
MRFRNLLLFLKKHKDEALLCLMLVFGLFIRIYALGVPPLWVDEAISIGASSGVFFDGSPTSGSGFNHGAYFLHYCMAFFLLFAKTEFFARLPSVLFGLLTIFLAYKIGKEYSDSTGLIGALFFSVFYLEVFFSRQSRYYQLLQLAFFASLYFLYKSRKNPNYLIFSMISFFIALDTHLQALVLAPFIILHIFIFNKKQWFYSIFPIFTILKRFFSIKGLSSNSSVLVINYANKYLSYASNMMYLFVLSILGLILGLKKNIYLSLLIFIPSLIALLSVFSLQTFAFRYSYFFVFPLLLFSAVFFGWAYDKFGKIIFLPILLVIIIPSNLFFPITYTNIIIPIDDQFFDYSAPYTNYKALPEELKQDMRENTLVSYFSPDAEFYIKRPDFVVPFSLNGIGFDQVSIINSEGKTIDMYSGADILYTVPNGHYYLTADRFSVSKLNPEQKEFFNLLIRGCNQSYSAKDLTVYYC